MTVHLMFSTIFLFFQGDDQGAPIAPPHSSSSAILDMLRQSGPVALTVLGLLAIASLFSWAIILGKWIGFRRAKAQSRAFLRAFRKAARLQEIGAVSEQYKPSPLVNVFDEVYETYRRQTGGYGPPRNITALERTAQSASSEALTYMEQRLTWLATIGAISPFIGLFGTIMGIGHIRGSHVACSGARCLGGTYHHRGGSGGCGAGGRRLQPVFRAHS